MFSSPDSPGDDSDDDDGAIVTLKRTAVALPSTAGKKSRKKNSVSWDLVCGDCDSVEMEKYHLLLLLRLLLLLLRLLLLLLLLPLNLLTIPPPPIHISPTMTTKLFTILSPLHFAYCMQPSSVSR